MAKKIIIGSRGSDLALWQAHFVQNKLAETGVSSEIIIITTKGDKIKDISFDKMEGKGFFTKEIETALLNKEIDLAVHSHKDLETEQPEGLKIGAVSYREDPSEYLLIQKKSVNQNNLWDLCDKAVVGTSSARRKTQLLSLRPDIILKELRGNVPTRIKKLMSGEYDAIMLAAAGVERLGIDLSQIHTIKLNPQEFIPAPAQGVLALQIREDDKNIERVLRSFNHPDVQKTIQVERKLLNLFQGGCKMPMGAFCMCDEENEDYLLWAVKADSWKDMPIRIFCASKNPEKLAELTFQKFNSIHPCKVMVSRNLTDKNYLKRALEKNGFSVFGQALININPIPFKKIPKTDWIFFSSKNAVKYFFQLKPKIEKPRFAAISKGTAEELKKFGYRAEFIGYSADTKLTGKQFAATAGSNTVLFPQAKNSMRSVQNQLKKEQVVDLVVYFTTLEDVSKIPESDIYVFTSPSNVQAFFQKNNIPKGKKVIAFGKATAKSLTKYNIYNPAIPVGFDELSLAECIMGESTTL